MYMKYKIYTLSDPISREVKYVGRTTVSLNSRLSKHLCDRRDNKRTRWIKSLGYKPVIDILDETNDETLESFYISYFLFIGFDLVNSKIGDDINPTMRRKISMSNTGKTVSKETRDKISNLNKNNIVGHYAGLPKHEADKLRELSRIKSLNIKPKSYYYKKIHQKTLDGEIVKTWNSICEMSRATGYNKGNVIKVCKNKIRKDGSKCKTAYGFIWTYEE